MPGPVIVTATDANLFWLAKGLVCSLAEQRAEGGIAMACFDLGLTPSQRDWMAGAGVRLLDPVDPLGIAGREGFRPYMLGQACRPFLPDLLPGHDAHIWLDADTWIQQPDGIGGLLYLLRYGRGVCCPELHAAYPSATGRAHTFRGFWVQRWKVVVGAELAERYATIPMINSGVMAAPADHAIWARWQSELRKLIERPLTHFSEQFALFRASLDQRDMERLPTHWNWLANLCPPRWNPKTNVWIEPGFPHQPIRIMHLADAQMRPRFLAQRILFDRGAYLAAGDLPEGYAAPPPPVQAPVPRATDRDGTP